MGIAQWFRTRSERRRARRLIERKQYLLQVMEEVHGMDNLGLLRRHLHKLPGVRIVSIFPGGWSDVCVIIGMTDGYEIKAYKLHEVDALRLAVGQVVERLREVWEAEAKGCAPNAS